MAKRRRPVSHDYYADLLRQEAERHGTTPAECYGNGKKPTRAAYRARVAVWSTLRSQGATCPDIAQVAGVSEVSVWVALEKPRGLGKWAVAA